MSAEIGSVRAIFLDAIAIETAEERKHFLENACAGDAALRRQVDRLLRGYAQPNPMLDATGGIATIDTPPIAEKPGTQIGPYELREQIGEGGFGVVYVAEQEKPVARKVALKIIKPGMDTKEVIARFEAERQALALMDHPNVAKVLDAGETESGRPYFVMELVKGVPITEFCDDQKLSTRERIALFVDVCRAVQHAHQKGVIHRDLKPSNIMVTMRDAKPVAKVIDFGVSKALSRKLTDKTIYTAYGQMIGTPLYMSPEQAQLNEIDVDTRSDVYSLGVLLYELLTGTTPFDKDTLAKAAFDELRRIIREDEPPRPSARVSTLNAEALSTVSGKRKVDPRKLSHSLRGELDWIVMKALEKDRNRRYESASAFAADIERYLADEPVHACPPSVWYRFRKFVRRKKGTLAAATVLGLGLLVAVGGVAGSVGWMAREREAQRTRLTGQLEVVLGDVDRLMKEQKWPEALAAAKRAETLMRSGDAEPQIRENVKQVLRDLEFVQRLEKIRMKTSQLTDSEFDYAGADRAYAAAFREYGINVQSLPVEQAGRLVAARKGVAVALGKALDHWAYCQLSVSQLLKKKSDKLEEEGKNLPWKHLLAVANVADPDPFRQRLRNVRGIDRTKEICEELARLARDKRLQQQPPETLILLSIALGYRDMPEQSIAVLRQAHARFPDDFWVNLNLGYKLPANDVERLRFYAAAAALRPESAAARNNLGNALKNQGKIDQAIVCLRKAIELDPTDSPPYSNLAECLQKEGKLDEALIYGKKAVDFGPRFASVHNRLGLVQMEMRRIDEAIKCFEKVIELDPKSTVGYNSLGMALSRKGQFDKAIESYKKCIELDPKDAVPHNNLGSVYYQRRKWRDAEAEFREAIRLKPDYWEPHYNLGLVLYHQNRSAEAVNYHKKAIRLQPKNAAAYIGLGGALFELRKWWQAEAAFREAVMIQPDSFNAQHYLGRALYQQRNWKEAASELRKATELRPKDHLYWQWLGWAQYQSGEWSASIESLEHSCKLQKGGKGDSGQWTVMALAHWKLAGKTGLAPAERARHRAEARRWFDRSDRDLRRSGRRVLWNIRRFHEEAQRLIASPVNAPKPKKKTRMKTNN